MVNKYQMDMCEGAILPKMISFSLPLMFSSVLQLLFNAADIIVVGRFVGENSLAAVGSTSSLVNLMVNLFIGISIGANVTAARYYGAKQYDHLRETVHTSMMLGVISGVLMTFIGFLCSEQALSLMGTPPEVLPLAAKYLKIYFLGMTANMVYNFGSALLRAAGDTKRPLYFLLVSGVLNVILNLIFVIRFKMDVAGVALATVISQVLSAVLIVDCLIREQGEFRFEPSQMRIHYSKLRTILAIGIPAGFQGVLFSLSNVVIQSSINKFGSIVVAGNSAAMNIEGFVYVSMNAFYQSSISFVSQNFGAGKYDRIDKSVLTAELCVTITGIVLGLLTIMFSRQLLAIYSPKDAVISAGVQRMKIIMTTYCLCGMMDVMVGALRGVGHSTLPMIVSFIGVCVFRLVWIFTVFRIPQFHIAETVYVSYPISWFVAFTANMICFLVIRHKTWGNRTQ